MYYYLVKFSLRLISLIPFGLLYLLSKPLYLIIYHLIGYRRKTVAKNLRECFPEKSPEEIKRIEKGFYRYFSDNILEICKMAGMSDLEMSRRMKFTNIDEVNAVLATGQPVALYLGHYANWEWISSIPLHLDKNVIGGQIYHKLTNKAIDRAMIESRTWNNSVNIEMRQTARYINGLSQEGKTFIIGFIADHSPKRKDAHHFLTFLHHDTPVLIATEKIIRHYGMDTWFVKPKRIKKGYYEAEFIHIDSPDSDPDEFELTAGYFGLLEQTIKERPELYLWTHNRFKITKESVDPETLK